MTAEERIESLVTLGKQLQAVGRATPVFSGALSTDQAWESTHAPVWQFNVTRRQRTGPPRRPGAAWFNPELLDKLQSDPRVADASESLRMGDEEEIAAALYDLANAGPPPPRDPAPPPQPGPTARKRARKPNRALAEFEDGEALGEDDDGGAEGAWDDQWDAEDEYLARKAAGAGSKRGGGARGRATKVARQDGAGNGRLQRTNGSGSGALKPQDFSADNHSGGPPPPAWFGPAMPQQLPSAVAAPVAPTSTRFKRGANHVAIAQFIRWHQQAAEGAHWPINRVHHAPPAAAGLATQPPLPGPGRHGPPAQLLPPPQQQHHMYSQLLAGLPPAALALLMPALGLQRPPEPPPPPQHRPQQALPEVLTRMLLEMQTKNVAADAAAKAAWPGAHPGSQHPPPADNTSVLLQLYQHLIQQQQQQPVQQQQQQQQQRVQPEEQPPPLPQRPPAEQAGPKGAMETIHSLLAALQASAAQGQQAPPQPPPPPQTLGRDASFQHLQQVFQATMAKEQQHQARTSQQQQQQEPPSALPKPAAEPAAQPAADAKAEPDEVPASEAGEAPLPEPEPPAASAPPPPPPRLPSPPAVEQQQQQQEEEEEEEEKESSPPSQGSEPPRQRPRGDTPPDSYPTGSGHLEEANGAVPPKVQAMWGHYVGCLAPHLAGEGMAGPPGTDRAAAPAAAPAL